MAERAEPEREEGAAELTEEATDEDVGATGSRGQTEVGATEELEYIHAAGYYDGCIPFSEVGRACSLAAGGFPIPPAVRAWGVPFPSRRVFPGAICGAG